MKKILTYSFVFLTVFGSAVSCNYLDKEPDTELTMDMVWSNRDRMMSQFAYVWSFIPCPGWGWLNVQGWETLADDISPSQRWQQWGWNCIPKIMGQWTPNTSWPGNYWHEIPQRIRAAYIFQRDAYALPDQQISRQEIDLMKVECRFLAAFYWWELARTYGGIAFRPGYIAPTDAPTEELYAPSVPFDEIVDYLDKELLEVSGLLPASYQDPQKYGRATSVMALTVRARMLLFAASPLVNGNEWYVGYTNKAGAEIFNTTYDPHKWEKAAEACRLALETAEAAGHKLYVEYNDDGTIDPFGSVENMFFVNSSAGNKEPLFPWTANDDGSAFEELSRHATTHAAPNGNGGLGVYQGLVDAFFMKNGLPITDPRSGYVEEGFSDAVEVRNTKWDTGTGKVGEITDAGTYNMYCNREPRFYTTVSYNGSWSKLMGRKLDFFKNHADNNFTHDAPQNGYLVRKKVFQNDNPGKGQWLRGRPVWLYRLGGLYLDFAEAENEAYNTAEARQTALVYLNRIRERAGVRKYTTDAVASDDPNYIHVDDTRAELRRVIRMERRVELVYEGMRWTDIRRWRDAENLPEVCGNDYGMNYAGENAAEFYRRTVYQTRVWKKAYYWMPVFISEMEKNPNLVQAPFWK